MVLSKAIEGFLLFKEMEGRSPHTLYDYRYCLQMLLEFVGDREVESITGADLQRFFHHLRTEEIESSTGLYDLPPHKLSAKTIRNIYTAISSFYTWAGNELGIPRAIADVPVPKTPLPVIEPFT